MIAPLRYVKRFKMEMELAVLPPAPAPEGCRWVAWDAGLLETHADVLFASFCKEIDADIFPSFAERESCGLLMREMSRKSSFVPGATWLLAGAEGYLGSV